MNARQERGQALARTARIVQNDGKWTVPSATGQGQYVVDCDAGECSCPDFAANAGRPCKHVFAVLYHLGRVDPVNQPEGFSRVTGPRGPSLIDLAMTYNTREKCLDLLERLRWKDGPVCPRCDGCKVYPIDTRRVYECASCRHQFSATSGTILHDSRLPLTKWVIAVALIVNARKGVSACQLARDLHVTYKTAWYLGHRIRRAMRETAWLEKFTGIVELDETYVGGKARGGKRGRGAPNKTPVFGARERGGKVRIQTIPNITAKTLKEAVHKYVDTDAEMVVADELNSYNQLAAEFTLERINHSREYVRGEIHTNSIESIWAILKRQVYGTHHRMSPQYMPLYLSEISFRFNHRKEHDLFLTVLRNGLLTDKKIEEMGKEGAESPAAE